MSHRSAIPTQIVPGWAPPSGCVRWYYGDSLTDGKWTDRLGDANHATLVNGATVGGNGLVCVRGSATRALGGDVGDGYTALSLFARVYHTSSSSKTTYAYLSKRAAATATGIPYELRYYQYYEGHPDTGVTGVVRGTTPAVKYGHALGINAWHTVAMTWDGDTLTVYVDGSPVSGAADVTLVDNNTQFTVGTDGLGNSGMQGYIDDVMLFSRAISEAEIADIVANSPGRHS